MQNVRRGCAKFAGCALVLNALFLPKLWCRRWYPTRVASLALVALLSAWESAFWLLTVVVLSWPSWRWPPAEHAVST